MMRALQGLLDEIILSLIAEVEDMYGSADILSLLLVLLVEPVNRHISARQSIIGGR